MSDWQGVSGLTSSQPSVLPSASGQLSAGLRTQMLADLTVFNDAVNNKNAANPSLPAYPPRFKSAADYMRYKKSLILTSAASNVGVYTNQRLPASSLITQNTANCS